VAIAALKLVLQYGVVVEKHPVGEFGASGGGALWRVAAAGRSKQIGEADV